MKTRKFLKVALPLLLSVVCLFSTVLSASAADVSIGKFYDDNENYVGGILGDRLISAEVGYIPYMTATDYNPGRHGDRYIPVITDDEYGFGIKFSLDEYKPDDFTKKIFFVFYSGVLSETEDKYVQFSSTPFSVGGVTDEKLIQNTHYYYVVQVRDQSANSRYYYYDYSTAKCVALVPAGYTVTCYLSVNPNVPENRSLRVQCDFGLFEPFDNQDAFSGYMEQVYNNGYTTGKAEVTASFDAYKADHQYTNTQYSTLQQSFNTYKDNHLYTNLQYAQRFTEGQNERNGVLSAIGNLIFSSEKDAEGNRVYSGLFGGILQAYLTVTEGVSLFGISLHVLILTMLSLVLLGLGIKFLIGLF